jgi:LacI family kdg operon repressor
LFDLENPLEAIVVRNDIVLNEVLRYMKNHDLKIPGDAAIIGIDKVPFVNFYTPTITIVKQPTIEMANLTAELLHSQIKKARKVDTSASFENDFAF